MISRDEWDQKALKEWQIFMRSKTQDGTAENPFVIDDDCMNERENSQDVSPGNVVVIKREADSMNGRDVSPGTVGGPSKRKREADSVDEQNVSRDISLGTGVGKSKRKRAVWPKRKREADNMDERDVSPGTAGSLSKRKRAVGPKP